MIQRQIILDGHDGAGKTTLAQLLANKIGGTYVKPFNDSLGDMIIWLYRNNRFDQVNILAHSAIEKIRSDYAQERYLIFDRHWLCIFTLLPEMYYNYWMPLPPTILCWTNVETTLARLELRGESISRVERHAHYCQYYRVLAERYGVPIIDTTSLSIEEALHQLLQTSVLKEYLANS